MQGIAEASHTIGRLNDAIIYFDSVTHFVQAFGDTGWSVYSIAMKGHCYYDLGDYRSAYQVGNIALKIAEQNTRDTGSICTAMIQLANLFLGAELPQTTIDYYHKVINYYPSALSPKQYNLPWQVYVAMLRAGEAFLQLNQLDSANNLFELMPRDTTNGDDQLFYGHLYSKQGQYQKALFFFLRGLQVETQTGHLIGMARHSDELGRTYLILGNFDLAIKHANDALTTGKKIHALLEMKNAAGTLLDIYSKRKNYEQIYIYSQLYKSLNDSLSSEEYRRKLSLLQIQNELDNQKQQAALLSKENELKQQQLGKEALARKFFIGGIIAVLLIAAIIFRNYRQKQLTNFALQLQKEKLENTLSELKSTQGQLIQSAKMASLGELTAGIAHEIQNPLNFVNNFSEINNELIEEFKNEWLNGNGKNKYGQMEELLSDITMNNEKINHHGKRAGSIVKGMLQHSRTSTGQKELTDINSLADEYMRLAYHGMRARHKSFNATIETDFDTTIGNIKIAAQDISRVLLNLYNNAFDAMNEKMKDETTGYAPVVKVQSLQTGNNIEVIITDNGNGIPANIIDKIFQPFFTTKPTGQGTGLGLSLSYDIVKAHNGTLSVDSIVGECSVFTISLPV